jgi:hypothetical protein
MPIYVGTNKIKSIYSGSTKIKSVWVGSNKVWELADDPSGSPGNNMLIAGNMQAGYFGVVSSSQLITGNNLASKVGISDGTSQHSTAGWLKFAWKGKVEFVAKKPIRYSISWDDINAAGCVFGTKTVVIGGLTYKVRLMKTGLVDPMLGYQGAHLHGSEWNRLMLPIHIKAKDKSWADPDNVEADIPYWGIDFTDKDLHTHANFGDGARCWCQENYPTSSKRMFRGGYGVSGSEYGISSYSGTTRGWRPVLELVS